MRHFACLCWLFILPLVAAHARPAVLLVSIDGMRWDYLERHAPPHLQQLAREGVRLERLIPTWPSKTYPNHYTLVTGLRAERHGIVANEMFDPLSGRFFRLADRQAVTDARWWGGEPVWLTAERQGLLTAPIFWPGSEAAIGGRRPTYWETYDGQRPHAERVAQALAWFDRPEAERPAFVSLYFSTVDDAGHKFGPLASETRDALLEVDRQIGALLAGLAARGLTDDVTLVVVSDHGMTGISPERVVYLDDVLPPGLARPDFLGPVAGLRPAEGQLEACLEHLRRLPHVRVLRKTELPAAAGYTQNDRIPEVLAIADEGWDIATRAADARREWATSRGNHGFDPAYGSMGATFIARGPRLPRGVVLPAAENIHVYNLLCALLGITPAANDGDDRLVKMLR